MFFIELFDFYQKLHQLVIAGLSPQLDATDDSGKVPPYKVFVYGTNGFLYLTFMLGQIARLLRDSLDNVGVALTDTCLIFHNFVIFHKLTKICRKIIEIRVAYQRFGEMESVLSRKIAMECIDRPLELVQLSMNGNNKRLQVSDNGSTRLPGRTHFRGIRLGRTEVFVCTESFQAGQIFMNVCMLFSPGFQYLILLTLLA